MTLLLAAIVVVLAGGAASLAMASPRLASRVGVGSIVLGAALGLVPALAALATGQSHALRAPWSVPYGSFFVEIDALSALFLLPVFGLGALAAIYGTEYLRERGEAHGVRGSWFFFNLLIASMAVVTIARNGVLFLVAWEVMSLASYFLVTLEDEDKSVRDAGLVYLIATHIGTAFLLAMFVLLGRASGTLDFDRVAGAGALAPSFAGVIFVLAVIGFGTKAGFVPMHVWLPEAHPAAPSHVSAVMSGAMIKMGIYGLVRTLTLLGTPAEWWGWLLIAIGTTSAVLGILFALAQHDLKKLLAYSSVENMGIVACGLGLGVMGVAAGLPLVACAGFAGALLHVLNHATYKGLLFLGAGAVLQATETRAFDRLGGLATRMPRTARAFAAGSASICGLPPFAGFVSEFLVLLAAFVAVISGTTAIAAPGAAVIAALALVGGLAAATFTKAYGITFLGAARTDAVTRTHDPGRAMRAPLEVLALLCIIVGLLGPLAVAGLVPVVRQVSGLALNVIGEGVAALAATLWRADAALLAFVAAIGALVALRRILLRGRPVERAVTWGCGYAAPSVHMQYSSSSFTQPLVDLFKVLLRTRKAAKPIEGLFARETSLATQTPDVFRRNVFDPLFAGVERALSRLRWLQHGRLQLYVLYIGLTLIGLLIWKLR